jgi:hypothetical protein
MKQELESELVLAWASELVLVWASEWALELAWPLPFWVHLPWQKMKK